MAFGPLYTELPLVAATATRPATRYVDETSWSTLIGNFSLWQDNINANAKNLSNAGTSTAASLIVNGSQIDIVSGSSGDSGYTITDANRAFKLGINIGGLGSAFFQIYDLTAGLTVFACQGSDVRLLLGGSLKVLSVDGSGFVKAT